jgi:RNA polymerase sigma factor (sigma-70 family)
MQLQTDEDESHDSALTTLYNQHAPTIFAYLRFHTSSREDAEDILLEVFLAALEFDQILERSVDKQRAWLRSVAHHKIVDRSRHAARHPSVVLEHLTESLYEDDARSPEQQALQQEERKEVLWGLQQLSALQQQVVQLHFVHGLRCAEIAHVLGKNEAAVRKLLARALQSLRAHYAQK